MAVPRVAIAGAGPVGLAAALSLARAGVEAQVFDRRAEGAGDADPRAVALAHGSVQILARLGVGLPAGATPIRHILVSQQGGFGRTRIEAKRLGVDALGQVVRLGEITRALRAAAHARGLALAFDAAPPAATSSLLIVHADGSPADADVERDYGQFAVVCEARAHRQHGNLAHERFTAEGPLALLPLGEGYSVVWCVGPASATRLAGLADQAFLFALGEATRFAGLAWRGVGARASFPLRLLRSARLAPAGEVRLGNAAQTLHPVAGQGLNLGLRDAYELGEELAGGIDAAALSRWRARRRLDRGATVRATDAYVTLFSNDLGPLRAARGLGLALIDALPPLKSFVARRMMLGMR